MKYADIDSRKTAFIFELDDVLYPEKDYLYQVYYLFANMLEYVEHIEANQTTNLLISTYIAEGSVVVFDRLKENLKLNEKYRVNFYDLMSTAKLPLKLLLYKNMLRLLQDAIVDRKKLFIVTNGDPSQQLNKIKQTEWNGLSEYLTVYFAKEFCEKPEPDVIDKLIKEHNLRRTDLLMIGHIKTDQFCAENAGIDYIDASKFI